MGRFNMRDYMVFIRDYMALFYTRDYKRMFIRDYIGLFYIRDYMGLFFVTD